MEDTRSMEHEPAKDEWSLEHELARLNPEQRLAVESLDGPVLVVAGPGTGKTQLLSLRVANILRNRDVGPENLLCLTFTEAGATAMTKRLAGLIGRAAYGVRVSTFHGFASYLRERYPHHFNLSALDKVITPLQARRLIDSLLAELPISDALHQNRPDNAPASNLGAVQSFISNLKRSGLRPEGFCAIIRQNLDFFAYIEEETELLNWMNEPIPKKKAEKAARLSRLEADMTALLATLPERFTESLTELPGVYVPYATLLARFVAQQSFYDEETGRSEGYQALRKEFFKKDHTGRFVFKDRDASLKLLSATGVFDAYRAQLRRDARHDFDDMIGDAIAAIEGAPELKFTLQEQYRYLMVDEFQDTNGVQMRLLDLLCDHSERPNILAVGDDDQAIMRFQGASVEFINQFERRYEGVRRVVLRTNYRSTPSLVRLGQAVARQIGNRSPGSATEKGLVAFRAEREPQRFDITAFASPDIQCHEVAKAIRRRIDEGFVARAAEPGEAIAVIAAKHKDLKRLIPYLKDLGIAYEYRVTTSVEQIASLQTLLALMRFAAAYGAGKTAAADSWLPRILAARELDIEPELYFRFAQAAKERHMSWLDAFKDHPDTRLARLRPWLLKAAQQAVAAPVRATILELSTPLGRYYREQRETDPFALIEFNYGLRALLDFVEGELGGGGLGDDSEGAPDDGGAGGGATGGGGAGGGATGGAAGGLSAPIRLTDVVTQLDEAERFGVHIDVAVPITRPEAITLTTAHSSKGLEYDLVYLIDADEATWHKQAAGATLTCRNLLFNNDRDDDDARRLLFVALTRARFALELSYGKPPAVGELLGEVTERQAEVGLEDIVAQSERCWQDDFYPDEATLLDLLRPHLRDRKLSVSLLNSFVAYRADGIGRLALLTDRLLGLPGAPSVSLEFGTIVHALMEDYLNLVLKARTTTVAELLRRYRSHIRWLDFDEADKEHMRQRLDLVVEGFLPAFERIVMPRGDAQDAGGQGAAGAQPSAEAEPRDAAGVQPSAEAEAAGVQSSAEADVQSSAEAEPRDAADTQPSLVSCTQAERWANAVVDEVPLVGKCDLLVLDEATRTIRVYDYKTGAPHDDADYRRAYLRQLQFYKLLLENSPEYEGWRVTGGADIFVEPVRQRGGELAEPSFIEIRDDDLEHLRLLIRAAWYRLQNGLFDDSAFQESAVLRDAQAASVYKTASADGTHKPGDPKELRATEIQPLYEQWLIEDYLQRTSVAQK